MLAPGGFLPPTLHPAHQRTGHGSAHPDKFIGIHFFSRVDKMKLVEIIRGQQTDDHTVARAFDYVQAIGKIPIVVNDSRGFFHQPRVWHFVMEGAAMLAEGIPAAAIENAACSGGMPVGPLAVLDETSLSLSVHVMDQTAPTWLRKAKPMSPRRRTAGAAHGQGAPAPGAPVARLL